jgi:hypothetical protein
MHGGSRKETAGEIETVPDGDRGHRFGHKKVWNKVERGRLGGQAGQKVAGQEDRDPRPPTPWTAPVNLRG